MHLHMCNLASGTGLSAELRSTVLGHVEKNGSLFLALNARSWGQMLFKIKISSALSAT